VGSSLTYLTAKIGPASRPTPYGLNKQRPRQTKMHLSSRFSHRMGDEFTLPVGIEVMSSFNYFLSLAHGTTQWLLIFFFVTIPLFLGTIYLVGSAFYRKEAKPLRVLVACIAPAIIPIGVLIAGVAFVFPVTGAGGELSPPVPWFTGVSVESARHAVSALMILILPLGLALGLWQKRAWIAVLASTIWWGWVSFCAGIEATMSITGNWL
jgi:hypothetical protein